MELFGVSSYVCDCALAAFSAILVQHGPGPLEVAGRWVDLAYKLVFTAIALGGVFWGYYRFVRGRTYRRKLTTSVSGTVRRDPSRPALYLFTTLGIENVGLSRFEILQEATALGVFTPAARPAGSASEPEYVGWEELRFFRVFEDQEALEPGESASEEVLLEIPDGGYVALKLELWVHSPDEVPWKGTAVVNLLPEGDNGLPGGDKMPDDRSP
jgi:hypothetical protein